MTRVGLVGPGRMGAPMARRLTEAGHEVVVHSRSGGSDIADVAKADVVVVCVFTDEQVRDVCLDGPLLKRMPDGATLVVHTTGSPRTVEAIAARGVRVVDAPVSGGPHDVAAGRVTLFVGGDEDTVARVRPVLSAYGDPLLHVGPLGAGQRVKLVNNALFAAQLGLVADAVRFGAELGVAESVLLDTLPHGSAASRALTGVAARGSVAAFTSSVGDFVGKDVAAARTVAAEHGADLGALDTAQH